MQLMKTNNRKQRALMALGLVGAGLSAVSTAQAQTTNQTAEGFDLTKQATTAPFPVMFDRPSGVNAAALVGSIRTLGSDSDLYKSAVAAVPELTNSAQIGTLLNDALSEDANTANKARATILKLINWYNSLGGFQIKTQGGAAYTVDNLDEPINTIAVGFGNKEVNKAVSDKIQAEFGSVKTVGDVMTILEKHKGGISGGYKQAFTDYAAKVNAQGADIAALSEYEVLKPLLQAYEKMYADGSTTLRGELLQSPGATEVAVAFFESAIITGTVDESGGGTSDQNNVPQKSVKTRWVDESGNPLAPEESGSEYKGEKSFTGYRIREQRTENGVKTYIYEKIKEKTRWVDEQGNPLKGEEDGTKPDKEGDDIPGYTIISTTTETENGNTVTINTYKKNEKAPDTYWFDEEGNTLKPKVEGQSLPDNDGKSDVPNYRLIRSYTVTQKDLDGPLKGGNFKIGDVINIYEKEPQKPAEPKKVKTKWVDEKGNPLKDEADGEHPDKEGDDVPGYRIIRTEKDKDGNIVNVYEKVKEEAPKKTRWVDTEGNSLKDETEGSFPDKEGDDIPGYKLVNIADDNGNIVNTYQKVNTTEWVDSEGKPLKDKTEGSFPDNEGDDIPGYKLVNIKHENGNVINQYEKVAKKVITHWVDKDGVRLADDESGENFGDEKSFPGYQLVDIRTSADGTEKFYIYDKVQEAPKELPKTGDAGSGLGLMGAAMALLGFTQIRRRKTEE